MEARVDELMRGGVGYEEAMGRALSELRGKLPTAEVASMSQFAADWIRDALFNRIEEVLGRGLEAQSTRTALQNALAGIPIPRTPGIKGGSAYTKLQRIFPNDVIEAIEKGPIEDLLKEKAPEILDAEVMAYLHELSGRPFIQGRLGEGALDPTGLILRQQEGLFGGPIPGDPPILRDLNDPRTIAQRQLDVEEFGVVIETDPRERLPYDYQRLPSPKTVNSREEAREYIARVAYDAVSGNPVDEAASAYSHSGNFDDFIKGMATPDSPFPVLPGFVESMFTEVGKVSARYSDPTRLIQAIDRGRFGQVLQRAVLWPTRRTFTASLKFGDTVKGRFYKIMDEHGMIGFRARKLRRLSGDVLEHISQADIDAPTELLANKAPIATLVRGLSLPDQSRVIAFARDSRRLFDDVLRMQNEARVARKQGTIQYQSDYLSWIRQSNLWSKLGLTDQPVSEIMQSSLLPDLITPRAPFDPKAVARIGMQDYDKVRDLQRLGVDYIDTASKDIFYTNIIENAKVHVKQLRTMGYDDAASAVESWILESFGGRLTALSKGIRETVPPVMVGGALKLRRALTRSVFPLNFSWNLFVQTSSLAMTVHRYGIQDTIRGLSYLTSPEVRQAVRANAYSSIIKSRRGGKVAFQDIGAGVEKTSALEQTPIERVEDFANLLTTTIEDALTGVSIRAAYKSGQREGLSGRALWEFASEGGSKTQSMYNLQDLPGILRTKELGAIIPFQGFSFEVMNTVRELNLPGLRRITVGTHKTTQNRLLAITRWVAAIAVVSAIGDKAINRKPWQLSSFIPFWGVLTGGVTAGNPWNFPLPLTYTNDLKRGLDDYLRHGDWTRLRSWAVQYHMIGGTQINRMLKGIEAVAEGKVTDVKGSTLFEVSDDEAWRVIIQGPYAASEGREYIKELQSSKGPLSEFIGIPIPQRASVWEREWRSDLEPYLDIPTDPLDRKAEGIKYDRDRYRANHPDIDAKLFIIGDVTSLKRASSITIVKRLVAEYGIDPTQIRAVREYQKEQEKRKKLGLGRGKVTPVDRLIQDLLELGTVAPAEESSTPGAPPRGGARLPGPWPQAKPRAFPTPTSRIAPLPEGDQRWQEVQGELDTSLLQALNRVWFENGELTDDESNRLKSVHQRHPFNQPNFNAWHKQVLRQVHQNAIMGREMVAV
jgi:uncharacterized protein (DUF433 family)